MPGLGVCALRLHWPGLRRNACPDLLVLKGGRLRPRLSSPQTPTHSGGARAPYRCDLHYFPVRNSLLWRRCPAFNNYRAPIGAFFPHDTTGGNAAATLTATENVRLWAVGSLWLIKSRGLSRGREGGTRSRWQPPCWKAKDLGVEGKRDQSKTSLGTWMLVLQAEMESLVLFLENFHYCPILFLLHCTTWCFQRQTPKVFRL